MAELTLCQAWANWWDSVPIISSTLWGIQILWLGRIGKVIQFAGAALIVVEIIGVSNINKAGNQLAGMLSSPAITSPGRTAAGRAMRHWQLLLGRARPTPAELREVPAREVFTSPRYVLELALLFIAGYWVWTSLSLLATKVLAVAAVAIVWAFVAPFLSLIVIFFLAALPLLALLLLKTLAWMMSRPRLDWATKVLALLLVVVGFHFDLLAS
ncbi:MAG: hypothetical protein GEV05_28115 [Betaproteobacteria bacterium]|nr:hypothetical protein [Betaproteobacteria bacterium]